jgi:hypothetical protein
MSKATKEILASMGLDFEIQGISFKDKLKVELEYVQDNTRDGSCQFTSINPTAEYARIKFFDPQHRELDSFAIIWQDLFTDDNCKGLFSAKKDSQITTAGTGSYTVIASAFVWNAMFLPQWGMPKHYWYALISIWTDGALVVNKFPISGTKEKPLTILEHTWTFDKQ